MPCRFRSTNSLVPQSHQLIAYWSREQRQPLARGKPFSRIYLGSRTPLIHGAKPVFQLRKHRSKLLHLILQIPKRGRIGSRRWRIRRSVAVARRSTIPSGTPSACESQSSANTSPPAAPSARTCKSWGTCSCAVASGSPCHRPHPCRACSISSWHHSPPEISP